MESPPRMLIILRIPNEIEPDPLGDSTGEAAPLVEPGPSETPSPQPEDGDEGTPPITI